jgi:hypothetical protein
VMPERMFRWTEMLTVFLTVVVLRYRTVVGVLDCQVLLPMSSAVKAY